MDFGNGPTGDSCTAQNARRVPPVRVGRRATIWHRLLGTPCWDANQAKQQDVIIRRLSLRLAMRPARLARASGLALRSGVLREPRRLICKSTIPYPYPQPDRIRRGRPARLSVTSRPRGLVGFKHDLGRERIRRRAPGRSRRARNWEHDRDTPQQTSTSLPREPRGTAIDGTRDGNLLRFC